MKQDRRVRGQTVYPALRYTDARAAIAWLEQAFGAQPHVIYDAPDETVAHAELSISGNLIMLGDSREDANPVRSPKEVNAVTGSIYVALPDPASIDALHERAKAAGARITSPPHDTDYGSHDFAALDLDGNPWYFGTYQPEAPG